MAAKVHPWYIERDDVEKDGSKGLRYGPDGPAEDIEAPRPGEKHRFRLIVSPEDAGALDLTKYVRGLMAQVENDVGRRLEWAAVNHVDTDHPQAHERRVTDRRSCCPVRGAARRAAKSTIAFYWLVSSTWTRCVSSGGGHYAGSLRRAGRRGCVSSVAGAMS